MQPHSNGEMNAILNAVFTKLAWKLGIPNLLQPIKFSCFGKSEPWDA